MTPQIRPEEFFVLTPESPKYRAAQTRFFETPDEIELLSASAAVLQDIGFQLGAEKGKLTMVMPEVNSVKMQGLSHAVHESITEFNVGEHYSVDQFRLDDMGTMTSGSVSAVKIDVENFEQFVFKGALETLRAQGVLPVKHLDVVHRPFERALELPVVVMRVVVVRRDEDGNATALCSLEELLQVLDGVVLGDVLSDHAPGHTLGAQKVVLRVGHNKRCL